MFTHVDGTKSGIEPHGARTCRHQKHGALDAGAAGDDPGQRRSDAHVLGRRVWVKKLRTTLALALPPPNARNTPLVPPNRFETLQTLCPPNAPNTLLVPPNLEGLETPNPSKRGLRVRRADEPSGVRSTWVQAI